MKKYLILLFLFFTSLHAESYKVDSTLSNAYYKANASFFFINNDTIIGINKHLSGELIVNQSITGMIKIDAKKFDTQINMRDNDVREIIKAETFPFITFKIKNEVVENNRLYLKGTLTITDVSKEVKIPVLKKEDNKMLSYQGRIVVKYKDFNIETPRLIGVIKVAKEDIEIGAKVVFLK